MRHFRFRPAGKKGIALLAFAAWLLLLISWVMSVYAYPRLPKETVVWSSLLSGHKLWAARSVAFFAFPAIQTLIFLGLLIAARATFFRAGPANNADGQSRDDQKNKLLTDLNKEVFYLGLIFFNLIFIHLQTSLILVSHGLARGISRFYFIMILLVLVMLIPYYRVRRRMLNL